jgi:heptosyltransferase-2
MKRLLLLQTGGHLGDLILTTPLARELRRVHPASRLVVITSRAGTEILDLPGVVDEVRVYDKRWSRGGVASMWRESVRLVRERYDAVIAAQRSTRTGFGVWFSGARLKIGFAGAPGSWAYNREVPWRQEQHAVRRYLELSAPLGGDPDRADRRPRLHVPDAAHRRAAELLRAESIENAQGLVCLAPGAARATKRWTAEGYAALARLLHDQGRTPILVGSPSEVELCREVARAAGGLGAVLAGRTGVAELAALLARSVALVGNDSAAGHIASAVGTAVVSVFGPTVPEFGFAPVGVDNRVIQHPDLSCRPCHPRGQPTCPLGHFRCMREIDPLAVLAALPPRG